MKFQALRCVLDFLCSSRREELKNEAPNSNLQAPEKLQAPSTNRRVYATFGAWFLVLLWMLEVGRWSFFQLDPPNVGYREFENTYETRNTIPTHFVNMFLFTFLFCSW
jgi:hypothetical protein